MAKISKSSNKKTATKTKKKAVAVKKNVASLKKPSALVKISKTYIPKDNEKYMCEKHLVFIVFRNIGF